MKTCLNAIILTVCIFANSACKRSGDTQKRAEKESPKDIFFYSHKLEGVGVADPVTKELIPLFSGTKWTKLAEIPLSHYISVEIQSLIQSAKTAEFPIGGYRRVGYAVNSGGGGILLVQSTVSEYFQVKVIKGSTLGDEIEESGESWAIRSPRLRDILIQHSIQVKTEVERDPFGEAQK